MYRERTYERHGMTKSSEYMTWRNMLGRCYNQNDPGYPLWGGRGITICDRWRSSFSAFFADVGSKPSPRHSLERIDNSRGYEPTNVKWATRREQQQNTRRNVYVTIGSETLCVSEWARRSGIDRATLRHRLDSGCKPEDFLRPIPEKRDPSLRGVAFVKCSGHWQAYANIGGRRITLGTFATQAEAMAARREFDANPNQRTFPGALSKTTHGRYVGEMRNRRKSA